MTITVLALALTALTMGPVEDEIPKGCEAACEKVTDLTAGRWPKSRKGSQAERDAFDKMREAVKTQCMSDCAKRGQAFVRCVKISRGVKKVSRCYQRAKPKAPKGKKKKKKRKKKAKKEL